MKILVVLATDKRLASELFLGRADQILNGQFLPKELRDKTTFVPTVFNPKKEALDLANFLLEQSASMDAVALLLDKRLAHAAQNLHSSIFIGHVDFTTHIPSVQNFLSGQAARLLRNLGFLLLELEEAVSFQAAILPIRNFDADELQELARLCHESTGEGDFIARSTGLIRQIVKRRGPRLRSKYPDRYFKDDAGRHFCYGFEEHSRFETGGEHDITCHLNGLFRFGKRLEDQRHFNVTAGDNDGERISVTFQNCHSRQVDITKRTHVNMFSNDFHK
ncbi:hypothetical protein [uncultured Azohydromonas sp.]|jgi:hypothetical protein|uniref:hypothetical protein n=1 Tax=uncultured Azohydromonas sp. TaxID=487342 RepID=UPI0026247318|nr:hypothetical protein [uncultured Azohydromonas sp.]